MTDPADERPIIAILGPTATGKTAVSIELARKLGGEIISADSMAVYRGMDVGTAKPSLEERAKTSFHLIDVTEPDQAFNVSQFRALAEPALEGIRKRGRWPILAGGTGLYVRAFLEGFDLTSTAADPTLRAELEREAAQRGIELLYDRLKELDPVAACKIHCNDRIRIVRALEVCLRTGAPISEQHARDAMERKAKAARKFGLTAGRDELYRRIDSRVEQMIAGGLEKEVEELMGRGYSASTQSLRSLGYKETAAYINGELDLPAAIETIKQNTRRYAKRQLTWFRAEKELEWIDVEGKTPAEVAQLILSRIDH